MLRPARVAVAVVLAVLTGGLALAGPARADGPERLDSQVTDKVGALDGREGEVRAALDRLRADGGLRLFVVYVRSFDGTPAQRWADQTATRSDFGRRDAVLAVATRDRAYAYAFDTEFPLTDTQLDTVASVAIEPALSANDWAGAAVAAADGYRAVLAGQPVPSPRIQPGEADPGGGGGGAGAWVAGALCLLLVAGGVVLVLWLLRRRRPRPGVPAGPSTAELTTKANDLLVELDNDLRASEQELALTAGRYGAEATASYAAALDSARQDVAEAFRLRMTLDETPGPDEATRRGTLEEIIRRCTAADSRLDAESEAFDALRDLEARVETELAEQATRQEELEARVPAATAALDAVRARYVGPVAAGIAGNVDQARRRLEFVTSVTRQATEALTAGDRPRAALAVRAAEEALGQAGTLLDAVERAHADLDAARAAVDTLVAEVETDLAAARAAQPGTAALAAAISGAEVALGAARAAVADASAA
ncbi:TPM domain-containing protein, partial [Phytohabitans suffuscus]